jgi:hypothetical protein
MELSFSDRGPQLNQIVSKDDATCSPKWAGPHLRLDVEHNDLVGRSKADHTVIDKASVRGDSRKNQAKDETVSAVCIDLVIAISHVKLGLVKHLG